MGFFVVHFTLGHETSFSLCSMGEVITQTFSFSFLEQRQSPLESISRKIRHIIQKKHCHTELVIKLCLIILSIDSRGLLHVLSGSPEV